MAECIAERRRVSRQEVWHLARPYEDDRAAEEAWWRGIGCRDEKGIAAPGPSYERLPTCPDCLELALSTQVSTQED